jgi:hypothetical protein
MTDELDTKLKGNSGDGLKSVNLSASILETIVDELAFGPDRI